MPPALQCPRKVILRSSAHTTQQFDIVCDRKLLRLRNKVAGHKSTDSIAGEAINLGPCRNRELVRAQRPQADTLHQPWAGL